MTLSFTTPCRFSPAHKGKNMIIVMHAGAPADVELVAAYADMLQVGTRNM
jgi:3-deoxy-D-arabino-heptulosonate 7-phosphate (DAHP) synthase